MGETTPAIVSRAPVDKFDCTFCINEINNESAVMIDGDPICAQCTKESIVPKFHAAVKHEIEYPVKWGPNSIQPEDFEEFFDNYNAFTWDWDDAKREYKTPGKHRVYCKVKDCEGYLGDRTAFLLALAFCEKHNDWVCSNCGHPHEPEDECKFVEEDDGLEVIEGSRKCPRGCNVTLEDGCNLVDCECGATFCYCCGEENPKHDHFSRGKGCPRFGLPGDERGLFNEDLVMEGEEEGEIDEEQEHQVQAPLDDDRLQALIGWARQLLEEHREQHPQMHERVQDEIRWATQIQTWLIVLNFRRPDGTAGEIMPAPLGPASMRGAHQHALQTVAAHEDIVSEQRDIMNDHRQIVESLAGNGQDIQQEMERDGLLQGFPEFGEMLEDAASKIAINLDLYVHHDRIRDAHAEYSARHEDIMNFIDEAGDRMFDFWPRLNAVFAVYSKVAENRLAAAAPEE